MCGVVDDLLPVIGTVVGAVVGTFVFPGVGTAAGAAMGGGLGGAANGYVQTHEWGPTLLGGATGAVGGYFGGPGLVNSLGIDGAAAGVGAGAMDTSLATGDSSFGLTAPTGFSGADLGTAGTTGSGLSTGISPGSSISGLTSPASMGGDVASGIAGNVGNLSSSMGSSPTTGAAGGSPSGLNDIMSGGSGGGFGSGLSTGTSTSGLNASMSPTSTLSGMNPGTTSGMLGTAGQTPTAGGAGLMDSTQAVPMGGSSAGSVNLGDGGYSLEGGQAGGNTVGNSMGAVQGGYGAPESTGLQATQGAPNIGAMGSDSGGGFGTGMTQGGHIGLTAPGGATGASTMNGMDFGGGVGDFLHNYGGGLMKLFNTGMNAYQQHSRQQAMNDYAHQINQMYSPDSPYAQQMQQTLGRQDAAAGRNSQYGTRATQLAAALTEARTRALTSNPYFQASTATPGASMLNGLFSNFSSPQGIQQMQQLYNLGSAGFNGLSNLF